MPCHVYEIPYDKGLASEIHALNAKIDGTISFVSLLLDQIRDAVLDDKPDAYAVLVRVPVKVSLVDLTSDIAALKNRLSPPYTAPMPVPDEPRLRILRGLLADLAVYQETRFEHLNRVEIQESQVAHRKEDIRRLIDHYNGRGDLEMVKKCIMVDFSQPLEPQLGFNPDDV